MTANSLATMSLDAFNLQSMAGAVNYNQAIFEQIRKRAEGSVSVLDFGAGCGTFANRFDRPISCVELESRIAQDISSLHRVYKSLIQVEQKFDFVYSINVLEHIEDDVETLCALNSVMQPNGRLFLLLPSCSELFTEMDSYVGHYRRYDKRCLGDKLKKANFEITGVEWFDFGGYWSTLAMKYVGKLFGWKGRLSHQAVSCYDRIVFPVSRMFDSITSGKVIGKNLIIDACKWE